MQSEAGKTEIIVQYHSTLTFFCVAREVKCIDIGQLFPFYLPHSALIDNSVLNTFVRRTRNKIVNYSKYIFYFIIK